MVKEKRILSYFIVWLIIGFCILFVGVNNVFAEEITPTELKSQIRTIYTDGNTQWYTSTNTNYTTPLYFGTGPTYSTYGVPCNFRLLVVSNIENTYSYKYSYDMHIFTPYSTSNTWNSSKIDSQYDLKVLDDAGIVKESKCSVINTEKNTNALGTFMNKSISCVFTVNKNYTNAYISAGYFCKGNCELSNMEPLGFIPQDSYMSIDNVKIEKLSDNSNVIIDQNQTIIDQNNKTNEELGNIKDEIKDQLNDCRDSYNLLDYKKIISSGSDTTVSVIENGVKVKGNWAGKITINNLKPNTNYYLQYLTENIIGSTKNTTVFINNSTTGRLAEFKNGIGGVFNTGDYSTINIWFYGGFGSSGEVNVTNIMLNEGSTKKNYEPYGKEVCSNKIDETNDKLDNLQDAITDSSAPNTSGLENSAGWLPAGPLDSILNLPLTMLNSLTNSLGKTCNPLNLTLPYIDKNIQIPCLSAIFAQITGVNGLWTWVGTIASVLILYNYLLNLYAWVDRILTLRAEFDEAMGADLANWGRL